MVVDPPGPTGTATEWREWFDQIHACIEKWGKTGRGWSVGTALTGATVLISVLGGLWAEATWHGQTTQSIAGLHAEISGIQEDRKESKAARDREMNLIETQLAAIQASVDGSLRVARTRER